ncbi:MAG TPA: ABC transporter ATP-binding protein [Acidimicrobiales bacterium]|jgi:ABC-type branched-subunit amino acid transport system ATPase component|nr:ABC transporter ATP-binding protein [Acidimicrobiales bacterium]
MAETAPLLETEAVDVAYGRMQVLFGVGIHVEAGETVALLGTNGAGKSTLLKTVSGLQPAARGTLRFEGHDITALAPHRRVELGIVQVSGGNAVFPGLSVRENLRVGAYTFLRDRRRVETEMIRVLDLFPSLRPRLDQAAGSMSGGEQQMVAIAKALQLRPKLLIIDELSLGLAPIIVEQLVKVLEDLKAQGVTMLIVEQSLNLALSFSDRAYFMEKGEVRFSGPATELLERGDLVRAVFLGAAT